MIKNKPTVIDNETVEDKPGHRYVFSQGISRIVNWILAIFGSILATLTLVVLYRALYAVSNDRAYFLHCLQFLLIIWIIMPPLWFWIEYAWLFKRYGRTNSFEFFKYGQDIAAKIWLGIVTLLTAQLLVANLVKQVENSSSVAATSPHTTALSAAHHR